VTQVSRRDFIGTAAALGVLSLTNKAALANPFGLPLGIQLYSVRDQIKEDLDGALAGVSGAGYTEVEAAGFPKKYTAKEVRASLDKAGLKCVSAHHPLPELLARFDEILAYDKELGVSFLICSSPGMRTPAAAGGRHLLSLDDWHYNAEQFNIFGERTATASVQFGYHNHTPEFTETDGKIPYMELLQLTDPKKVTFELDCGWAIVAGVPPVEILKNHPHRISMLHVKDFELSPNHKPGDPEPKVTELGHGSADYGPIFAQAAKTQHIVHAFVEQEAFTIPWRESLKVDAGFMRKFKA
jgi:sugar phosphate isomerase/epimerase